MTPRQRLRETARAMRAAAAQHGRASPQYRAAVEAHARAVLAYSAAVHAKR